MKLHEIAEPAAPEPLQHSFSNTAEIRASVWPYLQEKIAKLNKKADRIGSPQITLTQVKKYLKKDPGSAHTSELWYQIKMEGSPPVVAGHKFVATIEHKDAGAIIRTAPDYVKTPEIERFYNANPDHCDHCNKIRRRNDTFIVQDEDGHLKQVGRSCLKDYLGGVDPKAILYYFSMQDMANKLVDEAGKMVTPRGKQSEAFVEFTKLLPVAVSAVRQFKYRRTKDEYGNFIPDSTANMVRTFFFDGHSHLDVKEQGWVDAIKDPTTDDENTAKAILSWFSSLPQSEKDSSDFMHNLDVLVKGDQISRRDVGYAVAIIPAYNRANAHIAAKPTTSSSTKKNEHFGVVGAKIPPTQVKVIMTRDINGPYGNSQLCKMEDNDGRTFIWFNNGEKLQDGHQYNITGTIKKHDDFKGLKQTVLTGVKVI